MLHEATDIIPKFLSKKTVPIIIKNNAINIFFILAKYIKKSNGFYFTGYPIACIACSLYIAKRRSEEVDDAGLEPAASSV